MEKILEKAIRAVQRSQAAACKWIKPNDTKATGAHAYGFHLHKEVWPLFFDRAGRKGEKLKSGLVKIRWQDSIETDSEFTYYGEKTRDEYRLTRFGKGFPFLDPDYIGNLLILARMAQGEYEAYILSTDDDFEEFFNAVNISAADVNGLIPLNNEVTADELLIRCFNEYLRSLNVDFPKTIELADRGRYCYNNANKVTPAQILNTPDDILVSWLKSEFQLFKAIENDRYAEIIKRPFESTEALIRIANTLLQRRKSRAGASLEHHLAEIFDAFELPYTPQATTEGNKTPDFIFPAEEAYHDKKFDEKRLFMLACKTSCKDRWRQVLNEADRIRIKHLFTLQESISKNQFEEMLDSNVRLVVPKKNYREFPRAYHPHLLTLEGFIGEVRDKMK